MVTPATSYTHTHAWFGIWISVDDVHPCLWVCRGRESIDRLSPVIRGSKGETKNAHPNKYFVSMLPRFSQKVLKRQRRTGNASDRGGGKGCFCSRLRGVCSPSRQLRAESGALPLRDPSDAVSSFLPPTTPVFATLPSLSFILAFSRLTLWVSSLTIELCARVEGGRDSRIGKRIATPFLGSYGRSSKRKMMWWLSWGDEVGNANEVDGSDLLAGGWKWVLVKRRFAGNWWSRCWNLILYNLSRVLENFCLVVIFLA